MKHPTSKQVAVVAGVFRELAKNPNHIVDMRDGNIRCIDTHYGDGIPPCGTVGCHAGEFAVGYGISVGYKFQGKRLYNKNEERVGFVTGMQLMARILGFADDTELEEWAWSNPEIWGNPYGKYMFTTEGIAFLPKHVVDEIQKRVLFYSELRQELILAADKLNITNQYFADWWQAVAERLYEMECREAGKVSHVMPHPMTQMQMPRQEQAGIQSRNKG